MYLVTELEYTIQLHSNHTLIRVDSIISQSTALIMDSNSYIVSEVKSQHIKFVWRKCRSFQRLAQHSLKELFIADLKSGCVNWSVSLKLNLHQKLHACTVHYTTYCGNTPRDCKIGRSVRSINVLSRKCGIFHAIKLTTN